MAFIDPYNAQTAFNSFKTNGVTPGVNGLSGFKAWECYMLIKYGKPGEYGLGEQSEYLIELPLYPEQVTEQISVTWGKQPILGRSSPLAAYAQTDLKSVNFELDLHRDLLTGSFSHTAETAAECGYTGGDVDMSQIAGYQRQTDRGPFDTRTWYVNVNKMLQMSCYPQYTSNGLIPPTTYFIFGQMILKGFVNSYQTTWKKPILNTFYGCNTVSINMDCYPDSVISASDMIEDGPGRGNASTQNTYNTKFPNRVGTSNVMTSTANRNTTSRSNARTSNSIGGSVVNT